MIPLTDFRKLLGQYGRGLTDAEVKQIYDAQRRLADIMFDHWLSKRNKSLLASGLSEPVRHTISKGSTSP